MTDLPDSDRRRKSDRRERPTSPITVSSLFGARKSIRRTEDRKRYFYVDRYSSRSVLTVIATFALSAADAVFTLKLVSLGAEEINPIMAFFLAYGPFPFLLFKYLLTGSCLILFLIHKNHVFLGRVSVKTLMVGALITYSLLIFYELVLLSL